MKWGILATGTIARKFASTIAQMQAEGERVVAVGSRHMESAEAFAQQYGIPHAYDSYEALAADPEVDAIYVATPNSMHYANCKLCLERGKHVLCEKPFTLNPEQAQQLYRLAAEKHLFLMEAFWIWLLPLYAKLRPILAAGTIGEVKRITCQYGFVATGARRERKFVSGLGGGALLDIGIYNLGFLRLVTGRQPEAVETLELHRNEYGTDDYSRLRLTYPGGCVAESVQTIGQELERNARIVGTKGSIFLPDFQHAETMVLEAEDRAPETIECPVDINGFEYEIREASACIKRGRSASVQYTPQDSLALTRLMYDIRMGWGMKFEGEEKNKMFRPMRRAGRAIPDEAAKHLLRQSRRGVLAVNGDDGYPFAIPVNYYYDQEQGKIWFHGAKSGQKVDALKKSDKVCFTVYGNQHFEPGDWAPYVQSTVVFGRCHLIEDAALTEAHVRELAMKYYPGKEEVEAEIAKAIQAVQLYELTIEHLTGKQIQEK